MMIELKHFLQFCCSRTSSFLHFLRYQHCDVTVPWRCVHTLQLAAHAHWPQCSQVMSHRVYTFTDINSHIYSNTTKNFAAEVHIQKLIKVRLSQLRDSSHHEWIE